VDWVLNPWDDIFHEFHITQCGWTFIEQKVDGNAALAAAVVQVGSTRYCPPLHRMPFNAGHEGVLCVE
jgi:hypothetical protein